MKLILSIALILLHASLFGQISDTVKTTEKKQNIITKQASPASFDNKYKIGLSIGYGFTNFQLKEANVSNSIYKDSLTGVNAGKNLGAAEIGSFIEFSLSEQIALRAKYFVLFESIQIEYYRKNGLEILNGGHSSLGASGHFIFQTRGNTIRLYILTGSSIMYGLGFDNDLLKLNFPRQLDISFDGGIGVYKRYKMFFLGMDLKVSHGLLDLNSEADSLYNQTIKKLTRQNIILSVTFSGA